MERKCQFHATRMGVSVNAKKNEIMYAQRLIFASTCESYSLSSDVRGYAEITYKNQMQLTVRPGLLLSRDFLK